MNRIRNLGHHIFPQKRKRRKMVPGIHAEEEQHWYWAFKEMTHRITSVSFPYQGKCEAALLEIFRQLWSVGNTECSKNLKTKEVKKSKKKPWRSGCALFQRIRSPQWATQHSDQGPDCRSPTGDLWQLPGHSVGGRGSRTSPKTQQEDMELQ